MRNQLTRSGRMIVLVAVIILMTSVLWGVAAAETENHAKTQVLLYLVGSDLETKNGAGTDDIKEIVDTFGSTSTKDLDVIVAFGGANKEGWKGMNIATIEQLKADHKTGKYGNGDYLYSDTKADMGSGKSLAKFLTEVEKTRTADRSILIISDHGNSYDGIGTDDITGNSLKMGDISSALKGSGLTSPPVMFDACLMASMEVGKTVQPYTPIMLGSEEIQRGSYDYDKVIKPLADDPTLSTRDLMEKITDGYVDSKTPAKAKTMAIIDETKLQTVRDDLDTLGGKLSDIADSDKGLHDIKAAYNDAVRLGITDGSKPTSVDLVSLLQNIKKKRPELADETDTAISDVRAAVVYERHNGYSPTVYGISIASPDAMTPDKYDTYGDAVKIAPKWDTFFRKILGASEKSSSDSDSDVAPPSSSTPTKETTAAAQRPDDVTTTHVQAEDTASSHTAETTTTTPAQTEETASLHAAETTTATPGHSSDSSSAQDQTVMANPSAESENTTGDSAAIQGSHKVLDKKKVTLSRPGLVSKGNGTYALSDPYGDASTFATYYLINGTHALSVGSQPISPGADGLYHIPAWDGRWYYLQGNTVSGGSLWEQIAAFFTGSAIKPAPLLLDMEYGDITSGGFTEYDSWISLQNRENRTDATLTTYINSSNSQYEMMITPYSLTRDGNALFGGDMDTFEAGSHVTSYTYGFDLATKKPGEYTLSQAGAGPDTALTYAMLPDGTYAAGITAYYDNDDEAVSDQFRIITIRNGAVVSSATGPLR